MADLNGDGRDDIIAGAQPNDGSETVEDRLDKRPVRVVTATIGETQTRCTVPPGSVIHYSFEDADTLRAVRADGLFEGPARAWSYTRSGARSAEVEVTWENDGRSEIELAFSATDRGTFEQRDFAGAGEIYCGDVTRLDYRGNFEVQLAAVSE